MLKCLKMLYAYGMLIDNTEIEAVALYYALMAQETYIVPERKVMFRQNPKIEIRNKFEYQMTK